MRVAAWLLVCAPVAACSAQAPVSPACPEPPRSAASGVAAPSGAPTVTPPRADVSVTLAPVVESARLHVELSFAVAPGRTLRFAEPATLRDAHADDASGPVPVELVDGPRGTELRLGRDAVLPLRLAYDVAPPEKQGTSALALVVDPNMTRVSLETVLALPEALDDVELDIALHVAWPTGYATDAASSLGVGANRAARLRGKDLRHVSVLVGELGHATFEAYEGHDEAAWIGFTRFDPRWVAAETATARSTIDQWFGGKAGPPFTVLLVAGKRPDEPFAVALRTRSVLVDAHFDAPWTGSVRMRVAHEFGHRWVGGRLWIGSRDREVEGFWWSEGVNRAIVREVLFGLGTLSVAELGDEANSLLATEALSPHRGLGNAALGALPRGREVVALQTARGSLYATRLDALLRKKQRSLRDFMRALLARAETDRVTELPIDAVVDAVRAMLGDDEVKVFRDVIERGAEVPLPDGALGTCFALRKHRWSSFELGFMESPGASPSVVASVVAGSAAARAGLLVGDRIAKKTYEEGRAHVPVVLTIERGRATKELRYAPVGVTKDGRMYSRAPGVRDEACAR